MDPRLISSTRNGLGCMLLTIEPGMQDLVRVLKMSNLAIFTSRCALALDQLLWPLHVDDSHFNWIFDGSNPTVWPVAFYNNSTSANIQKKIAAVVAAVDVVAAVARLKWSFVNVFHLSSCCCCLDGLDRLVETFISSFFLSIPKS